MSSTKTPTNPNKYSNNNNNSNIDNDTEIIYENKIQIEPSSSLPKFSSVIQNMKNLISKNISLHLYKNALFYAEKNLCISTTHDLNSIYENIYLLAKCLFLNKEYSRCVNLIQKYNVVYYNLNFLILYGQALFNCDDYDSVILYLEKDPLPLEFYNPQSSETKNLYSILHLLLGKA